MTGDRTGQRGARPKGQAPTLADVARAAGVSTATVSRCLNAPSRVGRDTRNRVTAAIDALGYAPNFSARALAGNRTGTVGTVIPTIESAIFARGIQAFQEALSLHGYTLLIASSGYREDIEADQIRTLVARGADALLLIGYHRDPSIYDMFARRGIPAVVAWTYDPRAPIPSIGFDNAASIAALTRTVLDQGHTKLAVISAETGSNDRARDRVGGVRREVASSGLAPDSVTIIETKYEIDSGDAAFRQIMALAPDTTAVMCGNDVLAVGAIRGAKALGLRVPDDISITGFDDLDIAQMTVPPLTTVHVPHREMGRRAADMIVQMIADPSGVSSVKLQTTLRQRQTLGPPRC